MSLDRPSDAATHRRTSHIVLRGEFGPLLQAAFPDCEITTGDRKTYVTAHVRDEAELFGILERLWDFGASLISLSLDQ